MIADDIDMTTVPFPPAAWAIFDRPVRYQIAAALRKAIPKMWPGVGPKYGVLEKYICHALIEVGGEGSYHARAVVEGRISEATNGGGLYTTWLRFKLGRDFDTLTYEDIQGHRVAWMKELIKEFES